MGRFYVELNLTVYADSEDEAQRIADRARDAVRDFDPSHDKIGDVEVGDIEEDGGAE